MSCRICAPEQGAVEALVQDDGGLKEAKNRTEPWVTTYSFFLVNSDILK